MSTALAQAPDRVTYTPLRELLVRLQQELGAAGSVLAGALVRVLQVCVLWLLDAGVLRHMPQQMASRCTYAGCRCVQIHDGAAHGGNMLCGPACSCQ